MPLTPGAVVGRGCRPFIVAGAVAVLLLCACAVTLIRSTSPSDATITIPGEMRWSVAGVTVSTLGGSSPFKQGDVVSDINGRSLLRTDPPELDVGDVAQYRRVRGGVPATVAVPLKPYPVGRALLHAWPTLLLVLIYFTNACYVFCRRREDPAAQLWFLSGGLMVLASTSWIFGLQPHDIGSPLQLGAYYVAACGYVAMWAVLLHFALVFPAGPRPVRPRILPPWWAYAGPPLLYAVQLVAWLPMAKTPIDRLYTFLTVSTSVERLLPPTIAVVLWVSYRRAADPTTRRWLRWIVWTTSLAVGSYLALQVIPSTLQHPLLPFGTHQLLFLPVPLALAAAVLRYQAFDLQVIVRRSLLFGALTGAIFAVFGVAAALVLALTDQWQRWATSLSLAVTAVILVPLMQRLQAWASRLVYGERDDPYVVLTRLGRTLEVSSAPDALLSAVVHTVAEALKIPYVAVELTQPDQPSMSAVHGEPRGQLLRVPMMHQGTRVGHLEAGPRSPGEQLSPRDARALSALANQVGTAAAGIRLNADLQSSRERLVRAREEERRRLTRDLHDGLGPALAALVLQLHTVRNLSGSDPQRANQLLTDMAGQTRELVGEIRRLVEELRPPVLDRVGLASALQQAAARFSGGLSPEDGHFNVRVEPGEALPALPAAVEVTAYRIALEAITNSARHADARACVVRLVADDALHVEVVDDGHGISEGCRPGVGLASMRARAAEVGGYVEIRSLVPRGTCVHATLPIGGSNGESRHRG